MSSTLLYLAIVAVWAVVLVPMWLRRDNDGFSRILHKRPEPIDELDLDEPDLEDPAVEEDDSSPYDEPAPVPPPPPPPVRRRSGRAAVIARRRRRTFGLTLLLIAAIAVTATARAPWWTALPAAVLLACHLALLRVAAGMDAARRRAEARARARARAAAARHARRTAPPAHHAEVIDLPAGREVFDQHADERRAVGD